MEQKLQKCINSGNARKFGPGLFDCLRKERCSDQVSFGNSHFCAQALLCEQPSATQKGKK